MIDLQSDWCVITFVWFGAVVAIKTAKIFNSPLSSDASESAFIIMENGDVYLSYFGDESNELMNLQFWYEIIRLVQIYYKSNKIFNYYWNNYNC